MSLKEPQMCDSCHSPKPGQYQTIAVDEAIGTVLAHDITEIRPGEFKGRAFKRGHKVTSEDIEHLKRLGKKRLYILSIDDDELHEDDAVRAFAPVLAGVGVSLNSEPKEGRIDLLAAYDGLLRVNREALFNFNLAGDVMCATLHDNTVVRASEVVAGARAVPLVIKRAMVEAAVKAAGGPVVSVHAMRKPKAGIVITGSEIYDGRITDVFAPIISQKIADIGGTVVGIYFAPDDERNIEGCLRKLLADGADLLLTTGGMSVDPDDVTRHAVRGLGATDMAYGSAVLPGSMFLVAYIQHNGASVPIMGIPACGMYHRTTVFDLILPRVLAGERIGRRELAALGHGGLCKRCDICRHPVCPFGKD